MTLIVTWLWQGLALAWIIAAAVQAMPRLNAATRHAIWWLALGAVLAIPLAHELAAITTGTPSLRDLTPLDAGGALMLPAIPDGVVACAAAIWAMTAVGGGLRIVRSCRALGRLKRASSPFDRAREERLPLWVAARDGRHRAAELRMSDCMTGACALGLGRPAIVVSRAVADALSDESLDEIVMHEQAHLDRYDDWSQLLLAVVGSLVDCTRPCDFSRDGWMSTARPRATIASCRAPGRRAAMRLPAGCGCSVDSGRGSRDRGRRRCARCDRNGVGPVFVGRLLDPRRDRSARLAGVPGFVSLTVLALAVVVATQVAPAVVFLDGVDVHAPAAAPPVEAGRGPEPARSTNVDAAAMVLERPPRRPLVRVARPTQFEPPAPAHPFESATLDAPPASPLDSRILAPDGKAPVIGVRRPPSTTGCPCAGARRGRTLGRGQDFHNVCRRRCRARRCGDRCRARSAGLSIGRFVSRASKAGANVF